MGLFGKKAESLLPSLSDRTVKFALNELKGLIWSSAGEWSKNQNPSHLAAIKSILRAHKAEDHTATAHLIPDPKKSRITVQMDGKVIDQLSPESQATVADRIMSPVPIKCRIQIIGKGAYERACVTLYHSR